VHVIEPDGGKEGQGQLTSSVHGRAGSPIA
jgi:hypothetical protein